MGLRFEDLSGIRQSSLQRKKTKSDASKNRDYWAFYQLELFTRYKAVKAGVPVESLPAPYTSKSDHRNGVIGKRRELNILLSGMTVISAMLIGMPHKTLVNG